MCILDAFHDKTPDERKKLGEYFTEMAERMERTHKQCVENGKHSWNAGRMREPIPGVKRMSYMCTICKVGASVYAEDGIDMREHWDKEIKEGR